MILMSCENVQEKSEQFKQEFATAITNGKFEDAERIANDAQTYYEGLSDSNKKKYETCFPSSRSYWLQRNSTSNGETLALPLTPRRH